MRKHRDISKYTLLSPAMIVLLLTTAALPLVPLDLARLKCYVRSYSECGIMRNALALGCVLYLIGCGTPARNQVDAGPNLVLREHLSVEPTLEVGLTDLSVPPSLEISTSTSVAPTLTVEPPSFTVPETLTVVTDATGVAQDTPRELLRISEVKIEAKCGDPLKTFHRHINGTGGAQRISITIKNTGDCPIVVATAPLGERQPLTTRAQADPGETGSGTVEVAAGGTLVFVWQCPKVKEDQKNCKGEVVLYLHP